MKTWDEPIKQGKAEDRNERKELPFESKIKTQLYHKITYLTEFNNIYNLFNENLNLFTDKI